jgi:hypothetical protein
MRFHSNIIMMLCAFAGLTLLAGWVFYMAIVAYRTWHLPICWKCGAPKIRRSESPRFPDMLASLCMLEPYRCRGCRTRFYALPTHRPMHGSASHRQLT